MRIPDSKGARGATTASYPWTPEPRRWLRGQARLSSGGRPGLDAADETQTLLRKRLRFIGLAITVLWAFVGWIWLSTLLQHPNRVVESSLWMVRDWGVLLVAAVLTGILWTRHPLSLSQLRGIEIVLFGLVFTNQVWDLADQLFVQERLASLLPVAAATDAMTDFFHSWALVFVVMIVSYGTLVPSTWRRCSVIVGLMASTPVVLFAGAAFSAGARLLGPFGMNLTDLVLWLVIAAGIAIFGAHRIEVLRREAFAARRLGQYQLHERLGTGGMGEVFLAEHALLRRPCAIKLIRPERARNPEDLLRFEHEAQATATLTHPNTVQVFDYGHAEDGTFYYVMEYLPGVTLEQLVKEHGPLPPSRVIHLLGQVCGALREAHAIGLIHRDIKPSNIMICERGGRHDTAKLLDFGLVLPPASADGQHVTRQAIVAGTPAYMSPEQAAHREGIDGRSDIYSVGAVAYFLLTGQPPFAYASPAEVLAAHVNELPSSLTQHRSDIPSDLEAVVLCCLAKEPAERYGDAESLGIALASCQRPNAGAAP